MASALTTLKNAVVTFQVPTAAVKEDPETGNIVPVNETITVELFLRRGSASDARFRTGDREMPGIDIEGELYSGYCITPTTLDNRIRPGTSGMLDFAGDPIKEILVIDARYQYGSTGLLGKTLMDVLGHQIRLGSADYQGVDDRS